MEVASISSWWEATPSIASSSSIDNWDMLADWPDKTTTAVASIGGEDAMVKLRRNTAYRRGRGGRRQRWKRRNRWYGGEDTPDGPVSQRGPTQAAPAKIRSTHLNKVLIQHIPIGFFPESRLYRAIDNIEKPRLFVRGSSCFAKNKKWFRVGQNFEWLDHTKTAGAWRPLPP